MFLQVKVLMAGLAHRLVVLGVRAVPSFAGGPLVGVQVVVCPVSGRLTALNAGSCSCWSVESVDPLVRCVVGEWPGYVSSGEGAPVLGAEHVGSVPGSVGASCVGAGQGEEATHRAPPFTRLQSPQNTPR